MHVSMSRMKNRALGTTPIQPYGASSRGCSYSIRSTLTKYLTFYLIVRVYAHLLWAKGGIRCIALLRQPCRSIFSTDAQRSKSTGFARFKATTMTPRKTLFFWDGKQRRRSQAFEKDPSNLPLGTGTERDAVGTRTCRCSDSCRCLAWPLFGSSTLRLGNMGHKTISDPWLASVDYAGSRTLGAGGLEHPDHINIITLLCSGLSCCTWQSSTALDIRIRTALTGQDH